MLGSAGVFELIEDERENLRDGLEVRTLPYGVQNMDYPFCLIISIP